METQKTRRKIYTPLLLAGASCMLIAKAASADDVTFSVIGAHEYELPTDYTPFNALVQYGEFNDNSQS